MTLGELQTRIREMYGAKDGARGAEGTFMWFMAEVGELAAAQIALAQAQADLAVMAPVEVTGDE